MTSNYIIVGDTEKYKECLVCVCGNSQTKAQNTLSRMLNNPTENDKELIKGHTNLKVKTVPQDNCWWLNDYLI